MTNAYPVKLTESQLRQVEELKRRSGKNRSMILRAAVSFFLENYAGKPREVAILCQQIAEREFESATKVSENIEPGGDMRIRKKPKAPSPKEIKKIIQEAESDTTLRLREHARREGIQESEPERKPEDKPSKKPE